MTNLESLAYIAEIVGAAAVVASLLYLAVQIRQGTRAQRTENYARALDRVSSTQAALSQDSELSRIFAKGLEDTTSLNNLERIRFTWILYESFGAFEFMYYTHQSNEIPDDVWERWSGIVAWWLTFPGVRAWWESRPVPFGVRFTQFIESLLADNPTDPEFNARWARFVETGGQ